MNEQRLQAYYQLIESLLSCPSGEEPEILAANQELLDTGFVQVVAAVAEHFAQEGEENTANWLKNLALNIAEGVDSSAAPEPTPITEADIETYLQFILEVLRATSESNGNPEVIYPLLAANTDKLNNIFAELLRRWATHTLGEAEADTATSIAADIVNLSNLIQQFPLGRKANNMEIAITGYEIALTVCTRSAFPQQWAMTQNNLGAAYKDRIFGEKVENIESAIAAFSAVLSVLTRSAFPQQWAMTQNHLGTAYGVRIFGEKAENIESAIAAFSAALSVRTPSAFPQDWAITQNNLGIAYRDRILGEKAENIESAIAAYSAALSVLTRSAFPQDWATTQNNLGNAYRGRIFGEKAENIESTIAAYSAALSVYTRSAFPQKNAEALLNLGMLYQDETQQFDLAYNTFTEAIKTVESLRGETNSGEEAKRKQAEKWNGLYRRMVEVCLALSSNTAAIEYIERSKTRNLVELIFQGDLKTTFPQEVVTQIEQLNNKIASSQYQLQNSQATNPTTLAQDIQTWRQQRQDLQDSYLPVGSSFKFEQFQQTLDDNTAIIEWYITANNILAFIIQPNGQQLTPWQSSPEDLQALFDWGNAYLRDYYNPEDKEKIQWQDQLETRLQKLAEILHLQELISQLPPECQRLILIPHSFLHLFPLHALPVNNSYLIDLFPQGVSYAPSCQILQQVQLRQRPNFQSLFAIQNPTEDLDYADLEVDSILNTFPSHQILSYKQATKDALIQEIPTLKDANYLHFSGHGSFNLDSPQDSCLLLAESVDENKNLDLNKCLTLGSLFERDFRLDKCRLVVLSACETGLVDYTNISDEYISLPSGFLYAGSIGVVSSLWTVNDLSTAFLMIKFSQNLQAAMIENGDFSAAVELQKAQNWLRNATTAELQTWASQLQLSPKSNEQLEKFLYYCEHYCEPEEKQFQNPYHWAGFCTIGL
jgi:CHAT domain-containing protein